MTVICSEFRSIVNPYLILRYPGHSPYSHSLLLRYVSVHAELPHENVDLKGRIGDWQLSDVSLSIIIVVDCQF